MATLSLFFAAFGPGMLPTRIEPLWFLQTIYTVVATQPGTDSYYLVWLPFIYRYKPKFAGMVEDSIWRVIFSIRLNIRGIPIFHYYEIIYWINMAPDKMLCYALVIVYYGYNCRYNYLSVIALRSIQFMSNHKYVISSVIICKL